MVETTNFQMLRQLEKSGFSPKESGVLYAGEVKQIEDALAVNERSSIIDLRNLRDFVVMFYGRKADEADHNYNHEEKMKAMDKLSGVTSVIDRRIFYLGGEV